MNNFPKLKKAVELYYKTRVKNPFTIGDKVFYKKDALGDPSSIGQIVCITETTVKIVWIDDVPSWHDIFDNEIFLYTSKELT